jgi:trehalose synthase
VIKMLDTILNPTHKPTLEKKANVDSRLQNLFDGLMLQWLPEYARTGDGDLGIKIDSLIERFGNWGGYDSIGEWQSDPTLDAYVRVVGKEQVERLRELAKPLQGTTIVHVNSTKKGGGVAELLHSYGNILQQLGINFEWHVLAGNDGFFDTTKGWHNGLQGEPVDAQALVDRYYSALNNGVGDLNAELIKHLQGLGKGSFVFINDPQPHQLIEHRKNDGSTWFFRMHIDTTHPNPVLMRHLLKSAQKYDAVIASNPNFIIPHARDFGLNYHTIMPAIDPFSPKNLQLSKDYLRQVAEKYGLTDGRPVITQVSRFDPWKDPVGVIGAYRKLREKGYDAKLFFLFNRATDDPQGEQVYNQVMQARNGDYGEDIHLVEGNDQMEVNAFQRLSTIILQKSLREGFGLTVAEALWKGTPVVATEVGGIGSQIIHGYNGLLVDPYRVGRGGIPLDPSERESHLEGVASQIAYLLDNPDKARTMGINGKQHVRKNFTGINEIGAMLELMSNGKVTMPAAGYQRVQTPSYNGV